ncbi:YeeE/YedE family protein [Rhodalgimonas zhirmunskyi]|uniref:YeeE/YedE family protein n=1 Tax=Rhodalgimonas zhirmunskyi TaxID=2964767 RepID=A0AAJ1X773_9RHOB|nr:YeeE/YedE family protein [Rhodoalgimonas zhirmunskyi]MDQ2095409.1 YeeE/YedE family protein [Rhodoalgimonas zhirmunskyi]
MFESLGLEDTTPLQASLWLGLAIGLAFGVLAQITRFCLRRSISGPNRAEAAGTWAMALAVALIGTQAAVAAGWISFDAYRLTTPDLPILALVLGGLAFGAGMILTRGCASRLAVLSGSGNLRAVTVLILFVITAHATLKGVLAPVRTTLGNVTLPLGDYATLAALPGGATVWTGVIALAALALALRSGVGPVQLALAALIGALVPLAWVGTGYVLLDEFDPIVQQSLAFTSPGAESLFYLVASTAIEPGFGPGLFAGALIGAALAALSRREFEWQSFESPRQTGRYALGAVLMGLGGVLAGGCTLGAGLSGLPTLGIAALVAFVSIIAGGLLTNRLLSETSRESGARPATQGIQPAE